MNPSPTLLVIAGSDPCGGAGIQADIKTATTIGVFCAAAVTSLTVQNSTAVFDITPLPAKYVRKQVEAVLADHNVTHIKIGMTGNGEIINTLGELLASYSGVVVFDPVLAASSGQAFLKSDGAKLITAELLPAVTYLTPNNPELEKLTNRKIQTTREAVAAAGQLLLEFSNLNGILVKGGHIDADSNNITDCLVRRDGAVTESIRKRIPNRNLHGTGCTYASAFTSYLCLGATPHYAFLKAGMYMDQLIQAGVGTSVSRSQSNGSLLHHLVKRSE